MCRRSTFLLCDENTIRTFETPLHNATHAGIPRVGLIFGAHYFLVHGTQYTLRLICCTYGIVPRNDLVVQHSTGAIPSYGMMLDSADFRGIAGVSFTAINRGKITAGKVLRKAVVLFSPFSLSRVGVCASLPEAGGK